MARQVYCDNNDGEQAEYLLTRLSTGDAFCLCDGCMYTFCSLMAGSKQEESAEPNTGDTEPGADRTAETEEPETPVSEKGEAADDKRGNNGFQLRPKSSDAPAEERAATRE